MEYKNWQPVKTGKFQAEEDNISSLFLIYTVLEKDVSYELKIPYMVCHSLNFYKVIYILFFVVS
jgi:hypothetical protein